MRNDLILTPWTISAQGTSWADDFFESIFFLGNGRLGIRGYLSAEPAERPIQKGVYAAGIFGEIKPGVTDFVNLPTPVLDEISINGTVAELSSEIERVLDMRTSTLTFRYSLAVDGKVLDVEQQRFLPREHPALILQRIRFTPRSPMELTVSSGIQLSSCNSPIPDDQTKANTETIQLSQLHSSSVSRQSIKCVFDILGANLTVQQEVAFRCPRFECVQSNNAAVTFMAQTAADEPLIFDKISCIRTSRDVDNRIADIPSCWDYDALLQEHIHSWDETWNACTDNLPTLEDELLAGLHFSMLNLMNSCSAKDPTVSIGARGLSHGRYKGCYFWDTDLFMLPFFLATDLEAAKNLCEYRVRSLPAAKAHSKKMNTAGARYPWMAALDGSEQCETWDIGCSELHITADVAYAIAAYCKASNDTDFYLDKAAEVFIETARFWVSRYTYRHETGTADLLFCKGPDEYCGITNNNLFTNVMVQYNLDLAIQAAADLQTQRPDRYTQLGISQQEIDHMAALRNAIPWPRDPQTRKLRQDDTFHLLEPVNLSEVKLDNGASYHHVCFDRLQRYQVIKQADVLLIMTRFPELFTAEEKRTAWADFEPLCLHDSTLSFASHALFALQNGFEEQGYEYLRKALLLELRDIMGNTGHEGLHFANMGEAWQAVMTIKQ